MRSIIIIIHLILTLEKMNVNIKAEKAHILHSFEIMKVRVIFRILI